MAKKYRRFIRINDKLVTSPSFTNKKDAALWYEEMKRQKQFSRYNISAPNQDNTVFGFSKAWMKSRVKNYPQSTWSADSQRLKEYVLPEIGQLQLMEITPKHIKGLLVKVTDSGKSIGTRTRVKALVSKFFGDAVDQGLIPFNPARGIKFSEKRSGKKKPEFLMVEDATLYLKSAKAAGTRSHLIGILGLCGGLRKSEMAGLKWGDINFKEGTIHVKRRIEQSSSKVRLGTKAGENMERLIPLSPKAIKDLSSIREVVLFNADSNFVISTQSGRFATSSTLSTAHKKTNQGLSRRVSIHGLRHTFGREFVRNGGSIKQLQAIMGHSNSVTTDLYSDLAGEHIKGLGGIVSYKDE